MKKTIVDGNLVLKVENDLTAVNVRKIEQNIKAYIFDMGNEFDSVTIDLEEVKNIDSIGISFVIILYKLTEKRNKAFFIINMNDNLQSIFKLMKLDEIFNLDPMGIHH